MSIAESVRPASVVATAGQAPVGDPGTGANIGERRRWRTRYVRSIVLADAGSACVAGSAAYFVRFGDQEAALFSGDRRLVALVAVVLPLVWVAAMFGARSYEQRFLWVGGEEFRRVITAGVWVVALVGTTSWALKWELARGFVIVALPLAMGLTLVARYARRQRLHRQRSAGRCRQKTLLVGHRSSVLALSKIIAAHPYQGLDVIGYCTQASPGGPGMEELGGLPVLGSLDEVADVVRRYSVETVAVLPNHRLEGPVLRQLGWDLEATDAELLLAPAVTEVAGPRVAIRPLAGLPLLHVERPELTGARRIAKALFDVVVAFLALVVLLLPLLAIAIAVKVTSSGPVFYRQQRVGRGGTTFTMLKFRTMFVGADQMLADLGSRSDGNGVLFKMRHDPRVTSVGEVLRRYSLDEFPQLLNVLSGKMSLVGPRPPLQHETDQYGVAMHRRFLVKPGMTGLWQISGRSDLSWEDSVRMDVRYVENWSFVLDLFILWKTIGAVRSGAGAY